MPTYHIYKRVNGKYQQDDTPWPWEKGENKDGIPIPPDTAITLYLERNHVSIPVGETREYMAVSANEYGQAHIFERKVVGQIGRAA